MSETSWGRRKYRTTNWKVCNAALKARGDLTIWLDKDMQWLAPPTCKRGRGHTFSDAAIQFCLTIKCLFGLPLRQTLGLVQSLLKMADLPWAAPDYSTVCRRQKNLEVRVHYRATTQGLHMLADSTGIKFLGEGEWKTKKHGAERRRQWRKVHLGIDAQTLQIRAIAVTTNEVGDSPMAADLLGQIPSHEEVASFTGDGRMTRRMCMRPAGGAEPSQSFLHAKERSCAKGWHSLTAMKPSRLVGNWGVLSASAGVVTTEGLWWRPR